MASSSHKATSEIPIWKYDVFLSFRGPDTRKGITSDIHDALNRRGIKTFMDDQDLQIGDVISPTLLAAIRESRFAIVVLSRDYASSTWCLDELSEICRCMEEKEIQQENSRAEKRRKVEDNRILPLFYEVDPTDVRHQTKSFGDAFTEHVKSGRHTEETVQQWRDALKQVANCSGWNSQDHRTHKELVEAVVKVVCSKVLPGAIESMEDFEEFGATRQAMNEVWNALKEDEVTAVGVYGMGGVGKTTLVKHVGSQACKNGIFDHMVMVVVSQEPDLKQIQHTFADLLGFKLEEATKSGRASRMYKEIMRKHNILIILDDIWKILDLSSIGIPSQDELKKCNSKVLLTTRRLNVCHVMKCQQKIYLDILSKEDSWTLFLRNAKVSFESTNCKFEVVARRVAEECKCLPIALIAVARALGDKDMEEWETAIQRLEKSQSANLDDERHAFECIKLSYDYLKDEDCRSYFLLCCLFPEDSDIQIEFLFRYAIGKGLFSDAESIQESRKTADLVVKHLKNSSLLLDSELLGCVRMHDVIRDTAIQIAQDQHGFWVKVGCGVSNWPHRLHEGYSTISLMNNDFRELPKQLVFPKLELLSLSRYLRFLSFSVRNHTEKIPDFFQSSNNLKVLDLSYHNFPTLPQSLSLLNHLQVLHLDDCGIISNISLVGKLKKLEILSMRFYQMKELSREIGDLTNLRILDVTGGNMKTIPSGVISRLRNLEELYLQCDFCDWGSKIVGQRDEMNAGFDEVTSLKKLRALVICISNADCIPAYVEFNPYWVWFGIQMSQDYEMDLYRYRQKNSSYLHLRTPIDTFPDWFVKVVIEKAETLECSSRDIRQMFFDLIKECEHGRLPELKHLSLYRFSNDEDDEFEEPGFSDDEDDEFEEPRNTVTWDSNKAVISNLENLELYHLNFPKDVCLGKFPPGFLFNLKGLHVISCDNSENVLLPSILLQSLPNLEELHCNYVQGLEYVVGFEGYEPKESKLRKLYMFNEEEMISICDGPSPPEMFRTLETVNFCRCNIRGSLFTYDVAQCLFQLNAIEIKECPFLERLIEAASDRKTIFPKLKTLVLDTLPMLSGTVDFECPSLEDLFVKKCPGFSISVSDMHSKNHVRLNNRPRPRLPFYTYKFVGKIRKLDTLNNNIAAKVL